MIKLSTQYLCPTTARKKWDSFEASTKSQAITKATKYYRGARIRGWEVVSYKRVVNRACNGNDRSNRPGQLTVATIS